MEIDFFPVEIQHSQVPSPPSQQVTTQTAHKTKSNSDVASKALAIKHTNINKLLQ